MHRHAVNVGCSRAASAAIRRARPAATGPCRSRRPGWSARPRNVDSGIVNDTSVLFVGLPACAAVNDGT
jgi:hypothetical protein